MFNSFINEIYFYKSLFLWNNVTKVLLIMLIDVINNNEISKSEVK